MRANILVVEDDAVVQTYYKHHLKDLEKAEITICSSGAEATRIMDEMEPDIVIMDYHLPDITGLELTSLLVMKYPSVIVIAVSGDSRKDLESEMLEIGAVSFLKKPVNSRVLYLTLQNFIEIVLSRKERLAVEKKQSVKAKKVTAKPQQKPVEKETENPLLGTKAVAKTPEFFFREIGGDFEYVEDFLDSVDEVAHLSDSLYDSMDINNLLETAAALESSSRKLNYIQEFPIVAYSAVMMSENLHKINYESMEPAPFKKLCVFVYDYTVLYLRWVKSVFRDKTAEDIHFMDFELVGYVMQMESIFHDAAVLAENDEKTADEGGSVEFF